MRSIFSTSVGAGASATRIISAGPWPHGAVLEGFQFFGGTLPVATAVRCGMFSRTPTAVEDFDAADLFGSFDLPITGGFWSLYIPVRSRLLSKRFPAVRLTIDNTAGTAAVVVGCAFDATIPIIQRGVLYRPGSGPTGGGGPSMVPVS